MKHIMDLKKVAQSVYRNGIKYIPRIIPGVGLISLGIREYKGRKGTPFPYYNLRKKEDKIAIGKYVAQLGLIVWCVLKTGAIYKSVQSLTNKIEERPNIERVEKTPTINEGGLEKKTIMYEDILDKKSLEK